MTRTILIGLLAVVTLALAAPAQDADVPATQAAVTANAADPNAATTHDDGQGGWLSPSARLFIMDLFYLLSAILFVFGLKQLSSPRTARRGNYTASLGMFVAAITTVVAMPNVSSTTVIATVIAGLVVGAAIGVYAARTVAMTAMPEMVALFNGSGGMASAVVAMAEYWGTGAADLRIDTVISIALTLLIGMVTATGSLIAYGKLSGKWIPLWWQGKEQAKDRKGNLKVDDQGNPVMDWKAYLKLGNPIVFPMQHLLNLVMLLGVVALIVTLVMSPGAAWAAVLVILLATVLGVTLTMPIGGADMPVVVSLLNSYSGLAACAAGFVLENVGLIVSGSLVGASGLILTNIMCKAMNRSLLNVLAGGFGQETSAPGETTSADRVVRQMDAEEAAMTLEAAQRVFVIPGYGMAVAQAQHAVAEMANLLGNKGIEVRYGVHPVAGRMPGHMNVLLAEANVPYEQLADLELNSEMEQCDVALILGANDVVNPDARRPDSQIAGMPIFDVDKARTVIVCKRSLNPGFAGIENPLFFNDNTVMLFGDAKKVISDVVTNLKEG